MVKEAFTYACLLARGVFSYNIDYKNDTYIKEKIVPEIIMEYTLFYQLVLNI